MHVNLLLLTLACYKLRVKPSLAMFVFWIDSLHNLNAISHPGVQVGQWYSSASKTKQLTYMYVDFYQQHHLQLTKGLFLKRLLLFPFIIGTLALFNTTFFIQ